MIWLLAAEEASDPTWPGVAMLALVLVFFGFFLWLITKW